MGHRQIVQTKIRRYGLQCLIRLSTVCLHDVLLKFEYECKKTTPNNTENENGLVHLINVGSFIRIKRVKEIMTFIINLSYMYVADFNTHNKLLTQKLLKQGYRYHKLYKTFSKFYGRYYDLISKFQVGL